MNESTTVRERVRAWYPDLVLRFGAPLWLLTACLGLVVFGHRGQTPWLIGALLLWASMWLPYLALCLRSMTSAARDQRSGPSERTPLGAATVLAWALLFRLVLSFAGLPIETPTDAWDALRDDLGAESAGYQPFFLWDNDAWRYLWDGHVAAAGISPYRTTPAQVLAAADAQESWAEELVEEGPWLDVLDSVSYREHPSVYPPLAQGLFRLSHAVAPGSVFVWKIQLVVLDWLGCLLFLRLLRRTNRSDSLLIWLAWNPLLLKEVAGSGHLEGALLPLLIATLYAAATRRRAWAAAWLGAATLLKLWPLILAPALLLRARRGASAVYSGVVVLGLLPWFAELAALFEALRSFAGTWVFNPGAWLLFETVAKGLGAGEGAASWARGIHLGLTALIGTLLALRAITSRRGAGLEPSPLDEICRDWLWILGAYLLLAPTVMPWYLVVALPVASLLRFWPWHVVTLASVLSYLIYALRYESTTVLVLEHGAIAIALALWFRGHRRHASLQSGSR